MPAVRSLRPGDPGYASGLLGITVPREYGGADVPATVLAEVVRVIAAADPAIAPRTCGPACPPRLPGCA